jgi:hypothetical protein
VESFDPGVLRMPGADLGDRLPRLLLLVICVTDSVKNIQNIV